MICLEHAPSRYCYANRHLCRISFWYHFYFSLSCTAHILLFLSSTVCPHICLSNSFFFCPAPFPSFPSCCALYYVAFKALFASGRSRESAWVRFVLVLRWWLVVYAMLGSLQLKGRNCCCAQILTCCPSSAKHVHTACCRTLLTK